MKKVDNAIKFLGCVIWVIVLYLTAVIIIGICTGCKLTRDVNKSNTEVNKDSTVTRVDSSAARFVDSSKSTKTKDYDRITYEFPPSKGDSIIINNNYYPAPVRITQEKGKELEVNQNYIILDIMNKMLERIEKLESKKEETKQVESNTRMGPSLIEWIIMGALALLLLPKILTIVKKVMV